MSTTKLLPPYAIKHIIIYRNIRYEELPRERGNYIIAGGISFMLRTTAHTQHTHCAAPVGRMKFAVIGCQSCRR